MTHYGSGNSKHAHSIRMYGFASLVAFGAVPSFRKFKPVAIVYLSFDECYDKVLI